MRGRTNHGAVLPAMSVLIVVLLAAGVAVLATGTVGGASRPSATLHHRTGATNDTLRFITIWSPAARAVADLPDRIADLPAEAGAADIRAAVAPFETAMHTALAKLAAVHWPEPLAGAIHAMVTEWTAAVADLGRAPAQPNAAFQRLQRDGVPAATQTAAIYRELGITVAS